METLDILCPYCEQSSAVESDIMDATIACHWCSHTLLIKDNLYADWAKAYGLEDI